MAGVGLGEARRDGLLEEGEVLVIGRVQTFLFDEFPKPLDEIEIGGIGRQVQHLDAERFGQIHDQPTFLIAGIIENERDRNGQSAGGDTAQ